MQERTIMYDIRTPSFCPGRSPGRRRTVLSTSLLGALLLLLAAAPPARADTADSSDAGVGESMSAFEQARAATSAGDWPAALDAYRRHLAAQPDDAWSWFAFGSILLGTGDAEGAATAFQGSLDAQVTAPAVVHYNLACALARLGRTDEALASLEIAVASPFFSGDAMMEDPDLASLRDLPAFADLVRAANLAHHPCLVKDEYRQFDFWLGAWEVRIPQGFRAGVDRIEKSDDGCVLTQSWRGTFGVEGRSWSSYDAARETWIQTWVGRGGGVAQMEGRWQDGSIVLEGPGFAPPGTEPPRARTYWTPREDGTVSVRTETSTDDGATWTTTAELIYVRKDEKWKE